MRQNFCSAAWALSNGKMRVYAALLDVFQKKRDKGRP